MVSGSHLTEQPPTGEPRRLVVLRDTAMISPVVFDATARTLEWLQRRYRCSWQGERAEMLVTHLAMALQRAVTGQPWAGNTEALEGELAGRDQEIALARKTLDLLCRDLDVSLPRGEVLLVAAYLAALSEHDQP